METGRYSSPGSLSLPLGRRWKWVLGKINNDLPERSDFVLGEAFTRGNCKGRRHCVIVACPEIFFECLLGRPEK